jgi:hypothetical protein
MVTNPLGNYRSMPVDAVLDDLAIKIYEPPLSELHEALRSVPEVLRVPSLSSTSTPKCIWKACYQTGETKKLV